MSIKHGEYHVGRLLLLFLIFASGGRKLDGLTKLAKLDFLLRYPAFLDKLLLMQGKAWDSGAQPTDDERLAVESRMIRYKYGPWDDRYYALLGQMIGMGLLQTSPGRGRAAFSLTERGEHVAQELALRPEWSSVHERCRTLHRNFNLSGSRLKSLIYEALPEAVDRPLRTEI